MHDSHITINNPKSLRRGNVAKKSTIGVKIWIRSLDTLVQELELDNAVLKIDCEGCEYDVLLYSKEDTLNAFSEILCEYHYGSDKLVSKLKKIGFEIEELKESRFFYNPNSDVPLTQVGTFLARKKT